MYEKKAGYFVENMGNKRLEVYYRVDESEYAFMLGPYESRIISPLAEDIHAFDHRIGTPADVAITVFEYMMAEPNPRALATLE